MIMAISEINVIHKLMDLGLIVLTPTIIAQT